MQIKALFLAAAAVTIMSGTALATPGDRTLPEQAARYGATGGAGLADEISIIMPSVGNASLFTSDFNALRATLGLPACASGCLTIVNQTGGTVLPTDVPALRAEASLVAAEIAVFAPDAHIRIISTSGKTSASAVSAMTTAAASSSVGVVMGFAVAPADQGPINTILAASGAPVVVAPEGYLGSSLVIPAGATQYTTAAPADASWTGTSADAYFVGRQIPALQGGVATLIDSPVAAAAGLAGRMEHQSTGFATRAQLLAASSSHFLAVPGTTGRGRFVDSLDL